MMFAAIRSMTKFLGPVMKGLVQDLENISTLQMPQDLSNSAAFDKGPQALFEEAEEALSTYKQGPS